MTEVKGVIMPNYMFMTFEVNWTGDGYAADWWVTARTNKYIRVVAHISLPVYGEIREVAMQNAVRTSATLRDFFETMPWGGSSSPTGSASVEHALEHMVFHRPYIMEGTNILQQTAGYYELLSALKINNPAVVIAQHMGVKSVRTVQDRIARGRQQGLITRFGQGRTHA